MAQPQVGQEAAGPLVEAQNFPGVPFLQQIPAVCTAADVTPEIMLLLYDNAVMARMILGALLISGFWDETSETDGGSATAGGGGFLVPEQVASAFDAANKAAGARG